ncbi:MAG TPA: COX15/CtaA family protein, partial [Chloroflexota bacterium]|nr:COX15/CtaA family protein [Chloroflexota bacterium]
ATVRVTGSGLGCPDWPTCHGQLIPPPDPAAIIEYTHRLLGAIVSPLIVALPVGAMILRRERRVLFPALALPILLALQIILGAIVVRLELPPMVVLVHLGFAMLILGGLVWVAAQELPLTVPDPTVPVEGRYVMLLRVTAAIVFFLILTGAYTRATGASWACAGFPGCAVPATTPEAAGAMGLQGLVHIHLLHRTVAYASAVLIAVSCYATWRRAGTPIFLKWAAGGLFVSLVLQLLIGIGAVSTGLPTILRGAHVAGAAAVWASSVLLVALASRVAARPTDSAQHDAVMTAAVAG